MKITDDMKNPRGRLITYEVYKDKPGLLTEGKNATLLFTFTAKRLTLERVIRECAANGVYSPVYVRYQIRNRAGWDFRLNIVRWRAKDELGLKPAEDCDHSAFFESMDALSATVGGSCPDCGTGVSDMR